MIEAGRNLEGTVWSQVDPSKHFPQTIFLDHVRMAFECLQDRSLHHLTEQSLPVLGQP